MKSEKSPKPLRWMLITDAVGHLGAESVEAVRVLGDKYDAIKIADGLVWVNVARIKRVALRTISKRASRPNAAQHIHKFEMHLGRLRYSAEVQLPAMIRDTSAAIDDARATLDDAASLPIDERKARRELARLETQLPGLEQRIVDTLAEIDRLERLDDHGVDEWYAMRGWNTPT